MSQPHHETPRVSTSPTTMSTLSVAIRDIARSRPDGLTTLLVALAVLGTALILLREVTYGVYVGMDPVNYLSGARSLLAGEGIQRWSGDSYNEQWPPLFSVLLALASFFVFDPLDVAGPVNATAFGLTVFVAGWWMRRRIESRFLVVSGCLAIMLSTPLAQYASGAFSEPVFILLTTLLLAHLNNFLTDQRRSSLIWMGACTALAFLTRYAGMAVILTVVLFLVCQRNVMPWTKARRIALYLIVSGAPTCVWLLRNMLLTGTLAGRRRPSDIPLLENIQQALGVPAEWWAPPVAYGEIILLALAALLAVSCFLLWPQQGKEPGSRLFAFVNGAFVCVYVSFMVTMLTVITVYPKWDKYILPIHIPLLMLAVCALDRILSHIRLRGGIPILRIVLIAGVLLYIIDAGYDTGRAIAQAISGPGSGFRSSRVLESPTIRYLQANPKDGYVFSNAAYIVYINSNKQGIHRKISRAKRCLGEIVATPREDTFVVWFHLPRFYVKAEHYDYDATDLRGVAWLEVVEELADGVVFRVNEPAVNDASVRDGVATPEGQPYENHPTSPAEEAGICRGAPIPAEPPDCTPS